MSVVLDMLSLYLLIGAGSLVSIIAEMVWDLRKGIPEEAKMMVKLILGNPIGVSISLTVSMVLVVGLWPLRLVKHSKK